MGTFNPDIRSMTPVFDQIYQAAAVANHAALYTVTDFSGKGICTHVGEFIDGVGIKDFYIQFTVDGGAPVILDANAVTNGYAAWNLSLEQSANEIWAINLIQQLEFDTSLKVEIANDNGAGQNITGGCTYQTFSEEYDRTLHPAGTQIPDAFEGFRPAGMPIDIMLVWYRSRDKSISNRMVVAQNKMPLIDENALTGVIQKTVFETTLNEPLWTKVTDDRNVQMNVNIKGYNYQVDFVNGILDSGSLVLLDRTISIEDFFDRFTIPELEAIEILAATVPKLRVYMAKVERMKSINLDAPKVDSVLTYFVNQGVIIATRKTEILT